MQFSPVRLSTYAIAPIRWRLSKRSGWLWFGLALVYTLVVQLPTLSPYRITRVDDMVITDSALMLASGASAVPASQLWGRFLPDMATINLHYPPLYFYVEAAALRLFGFSLLTTGALHVVLRVLAAGVFYALCKRVGLAAAVSAGLMIAWATLARGEVGRPEDLGLLCSAAALWSLLRPQRSRRDVMVAGVCCGAAFLSHPVILFLCAPAAFCAIWLYYPANRTRMSGLFLAVTAATCALWLLWIIPYFDAFMSVFVMFVLPISATESYTAGLLAWLHFVVVGYPDSSISQYSLLPALALLLALCALTRSRRVYRALPLLAPVLFLLVMGRSRAGYYMVCLLAASVLLALTLAAGRYAAVDRPQAWSKVVLAALALVIALQAGLHVIREGLYSAGDVLLAARCGVDLHPEVFEAIPAGAAVLTNNPYAFYRLRGEHPIYWPGGEYGSLPFGRRFQVRYDDIDWLLLENRIDESTLLHRRFSNSSGVDYFRTHFVLAARSTLDECRDDSGLSSYGGGGVPQVLALYERAR